MAKSPRPWKTIQSQEMFRAGFIKIRKEECALPNGNKMAGYYIFDFPNWVNIIPLTKEKQIIMVEQYRHASGEVTLELPGGAVDKPGEAPKEAALRELLEETGYRPKKLINEIKHRPNPAIQNNYMYTYVALNCEKVSELKLDPYEEINVVLLTFEELKERISKGQISHSIILASLFLNWEFLEKEMQEN